MHEVGGRLDLCFPSPPAGKLLEDLMASSNDRSRFDDICITFRGNRAPVFFEKDTIKALTEINSRRQRLGSRPRASLCRLP